jgi:hypothetical protein
MSCLPPLAPLMLDARPPQIVVRLAQAAIANKCCLRTHRRLLASRAEYDCRWLDNKPDARKPDQPSILRKSKRPQAFSPAAYRAQYKLSTPPRPHPGFGSLNRVERRVKSQIQIRTKEQNHCCKAVTTNRRVGVNPLSFHNPRLTRKRESAGLGSRDSRSLRFE